MCLIYSLDDVRVICIGMHMPFEVYEMYQNLNTKCLHVIIPGCFLSVEPQLKSLQSISNKLVESKSQPR